MACEYICDGCGKRKLAVRNEHNWIKPYDWYERSDKDGIQTACSRECIAKIAERTSKTNLVLLI